MDTIPPPSAHSSIPRVMAVTRTVSPRGLAASTAWMDTVFGDDGTAARAAASMSVVGGPDQPAHALQHRGRQRQAEAALGAAEALREGAHLGVQRVDRLGLADRVGEVERAAVLQRLELHRLAVAGWPSAPSSARRPGCAGRRGSWGRFGGSRSRPPAHTSTRSGVVPSSRTARTAITLVLPGEDPMPSSASSPASWKRSCSRQLLAGQVVEPAEVDVVRARLAGRPPSRRGSPGSWRRSPARPLPRAPPPVPSARRQPWRVPCRRRGARPRRPLAPHPGRAAPARRPRRTRPGRALSRGR